MEDRNQSRPAPSGIMFWVLILPAAVVFALCVLAPVWRDYTALRVAEQLERRDVEAFEKEVADQRRHFDALREDPLAVARVAQRDLAFTDPNATLVAVDVGPFARLVCSDQPLESIAPPHAATRILAWIPYSDRVDLYTGGRTRSLLLVLSAAVIAAAVFLHTKPSSTMHTSEQ